MPSFARCRQLTARRMMNGEALYSLAPDAAVVLQLPRCGGRCGGETSALILSLILERTSATERSRMPDVNNTSDSDRYKRGTRTGARETPELFFYSCLAGELVGAICRTYRDKSSALNARSFNPTFSLMRVSLREPLPFSLCHKVGGQERMFYAAALWRVKAEAAE